MRGEQDDDRIPRWLRVTLGTLGDIVLFAALSLVIWTVLPAVALGATPMIIGGGSMAPLLRTGDVILLDDTPPPEGEMFAPGTVITFEAVDRDGVAVGELVTHRVATLREGHYVTRGDANNSNDPRPVHPDQLVGTGRWLIPVVGLPAHWARTGAWHLVALTILGGIASVAASLVGRRRVAIEVPDDVAEDVPIELPEGFPEQELFPEPVAAAPVLAFHLEPDAPTETPLPAEDDEAMDPAAAERAAAIAAQAARRSMAGLDRVLEEQEAEEEVRRTRRSDRQDGSAGSAPVASLIALAIALIGSTVVPSFAAAAYVATTNSTSNSFSVAESDPTGDVDVLVELRDDSGDRYCANVTVSTTSPTPIVWDFAIDLTEAPTYGGAPTSFENFVGSFDAPILHGHGISWNETVVAGSPRVVGFCATRTAAPQTIVIPAHDGNTVLTPPQNTETPYAWGIAPVGPVIVAGPIHTSIEVRRSQPPGGNVDRYVWLEVLIDGDIVSQNQLWWNGSAPANPEWQTFNVTLWQPFDPQVIGPDTDIRFRIRAYRLDVRVTGATTVTLPVHQ